MARLEGYEYKTIDLPNRKGARAKKLQKFTDKGWEIVQFTRSRWHLRDDQVELRRGPWIPPSKPVTEPSTSLTDRPAHATERMAAKAEEAKEKRKVITAKAEENRKKADARNERMRQWSDRKLEEIKQKRERKKGDES
jgi:hypothetical protein